MNHARRAAVTGLIVCIAICLIGCWDSKNPQDINYFTALGFDYEDGRHVVYAQMLDFATISSPDKSKPAEKIPIWTGRGVGDTVASAFNDLYDSAQLRIFYGHVNSMVFGKKIMEHGLDSIFDLISRYYELRYTPWVFGTQEDIQTLLSTTPFFNMSPMSSLLHQPQEIFMQKSVVKPLMLREFIADIREPGKTALLPALGLVSAEWKEGMKPKEIISLDGAFALHSNKVEAYLDVPQIMGLRWTIPETMRSPLVVRDKQGTIYAVISPSHPNITITPLVQNDQVRYKMNIRLQAEVVEVVEQLPELELERLASEHVREEVLATFEKALAHHVDIYSLEHVLYRKNNRYWKKISESHERNVTKDALEVQVAVNIIYSGKLKLRTKSPN